MTSAEIAILLANGALLALISSLLEKVSVFQNLSPTQKLNVVTVLVILVTLGATFLNKPADTDWLVFIGEVLTKTVIFWASVKGYHSINNG